CAQDRVRELRRQADQGDRAHGVRAQGGRLAQGSLRQAQGGRREARGQAPGEGRREGRRQGGEGGREARGETREEAGRTARSIDGKAVGAEVRSRVTRASAELRAAGKVPGLAVVLVGEDPASVIYVRNKTAAARECGIEVHDHKLPATTGQA